MEEENKSEINRKNLSFSLGNKDFRAGNYEAAIRHLDAALSDTPPELQKHIKFNIELAKYKLGSKAIDLSSFESEVFVQMLPEPVEANIEKSNCLGDSCNPARKELICSLSLFDDAWYLENNPDVKKANVDPFEHYMKYGWKERRRFHSLRYDFNKYLSVYADVKIRNINPILHYIDHGRNEGRHLFLNDEYINELNPKDHLPILNYIEYKRSRGVANTVVFTINFDANGVMNDPAVIDPEVDYIYLGLPGDKKNLSSVWEYRPLTYFLEDFNKLSSYCCYNAAGLLPEYEVVIYVQDQACLSTKAFKSILSAMAFSPNGFYVSGKIESLTDNNFYQAMEEVNAEVCQEDQVATDEFSSELVRPNCIAVKRTSLKVSRFFAAWWLQTVKFDMDRLIPVGLIEQFGGEVISEESQGLSKLHLKESDYCKYLDSHLSTVVRSPLNLLKHKEKLDKAKVVIVVPVFNALEDVKQCLASIETSTHPNFHLLIADDASDEKVVTWLREYTKGCSYATLIGSEENLGYTKNVNRAIASAENFDYIILLNSDTIVCGNWIEKLLFCFFDDDTVGIAGPLSNAAGWQTAPNLRGDSSLPPHLNVKKINIFLENNAHPYYPVSDLVNGFCMCIKKKVLTEVGKFDEESFPRGYGEEDDFCMRARAAGYKNVLATTAFVYHSKSKSFGHSQRVELATASRKVLDEKYGKDGYRLLTESIGKNPVIEAVRTDLRKLYSPYSKTYTTIGEEVCKIETKRTLHRTKNPTILVHLHLHYLSMANYFAAYLKNIPFDFDLFLTVSQEVDESKLRAAFDLPRSKNVAIRYFENRGRDVLPFLEVLKEVDDGYEYALHIHSKKSVHNPSFGTSWLSHLMSQLLYSEAYVENLIYLMESFNVGLIVPEVIDKLLPSYKWGRNKEIVEKLFSRINVNSIDLDSKLIFSAGNMFWVKPAALKKLYTAGIKANEFPPEPIPIDGTLAHALERAWGFIVNDAGLKTIIAKPDNHHVLINERWMFERKLTTPSNIEDLVAQKINSKEPLALIRYYDGEGAFYKAGNWTNEFLKDRMVYYFGEGDYGRHDAEEIRDSILTSMESADIVGIPNLDIFDNMVAFMQRYANGSIEKLPYIKRRYNKSIDCNSAWRIISSFELVINALSSDAVFCTKDIHYDLLLSGGLYRLMNRAEKICVITSQPVAGYIEQIFGKAVRQYSVPQRAIDNDNLNDTRHYPYVYNDILTSLQGSDLTGELFLVGAGPLGKAYCQKIKERGGMAIDIGAVFDSWMNFHTRPEHSREGKEFDANLLLTSKNVWRLTSGQVEPKSTVGVEDLPSKKINKYLK